MLTLLTFCPAVPHKAECIQHYQPPLPPLLDLLLPSPCSALYKLFVLTLTLCLKTLSIDEHLLSICHTYIEISSRNEYRKYRKPSHWHCMVLKRFHEQNCIKWNVIRLNLLWQNNSCFNKVLLFNRSHLTTKTIGIAPSIQDLVSLKTLKHFDYSVLVKRPTRWQSLYVIETRARVNILATEWRLTPAHKPQPPAPTGGWGLGGWHQYKSWPQIINCILN